MTMSRHWVRNKETDALERNSSSHGIPGRYNKMTPEVYFFFLDSQKTTHALCCKQFKKEAERIYNKYYPIEISQTMTYEEKVPYMIQWWTEAHAVLVQQKLSKQGLIHLSYFCHSTLFRLDRDDQTGQTGAEIPCGSSLAPLSSTLDSIPCVFCWYR